MPLTNSATRYGSVARGLHWLTALLILTAFPLGLYADGLPYDTATALAEKARVFSLHKTLGVAVFFVALARILWALTQAHPNPVHPERRVEGFMAALVHWLLYISLLAVPLSGWIHHAAVDGFAPILWPFGQDLPLVPKSETVSHIATGAHWLFTKLLLVSLILHVLGAVKHAVIDRDGTLSRMVSGRDAGPRQAQGPGRAPMLAAFAVYLAGFGAVWAMTQPAAPPAPGQTASAAAPATVPAPASPAAVNPPAAISPAGPTPVADAPALGAQPNWQVDSGSLGFSVLQMGAAVSGTLPDWQADIRFDETPVDGRHGHVSVTIATPSLTLGSVSDQARGADFFDVASHPQAVFDADILPDGAGFIAEGTLSLRGVTVPVRLPFTLEITGNTARMQGSARLDRRDFGMGATYTDESSVGFGVEVAVDLTARRLP